MGVRHLQTFIERQVQRGTYPVHMGNEIQCAKNRDQKPIVVIDLMALFGVFCNDKHGLLCGCQIMLVERNADEFFRRLIAAGAELVFFYDGSPQPTKYGTWCARQNRKYDNMIAIIDAIDMGTSVEKVINLHGRNIPNNTSALKLERVAKQHGMVITSMHTECDQALAAYATKHNALAVISQDTDFLIYQGDWQLWSANHINRESLETIGYNRRALLMTLQLEWHQMPVLATLGGNDFFNYDEVEPFHQAIGAIHHKKFFRLAEFVRSLPKSEGHDMDDRTVNCIVARIYKKRIIPREAHEWFKQSINFYQTTISGKDSQFFSMCPTMDQTKMFLLKEDHQSEYNILTGGPINATLYFFDYRTADFGNFFDIISPIVSRIGGIILFHHRHEGIQHVTVCTKRSHKEPHAQHTIAVEFPTIPVPRMMELLSPDPIPGDLLQQKLALLAWVCSDHLPFESFAVLPPSLMIVIMTLFRLMEQGVLLLYEADLLLWIAHELATNRFNPETEIRPYRLDPRAFRVGFLFQKVYVRCDKAAKSLGLPQIYRPSVPYDGFRFHNQYRAWRDGQMQQQLASIADWRLYSTIARES